ncbi:MAG TPA: YbjQ family protein [Candidatus Aenigmarchaeota archaeon]|nr:YbjQ family protein [Candidatus Aenigmarchaeota archaeon]
MIVTTTENVPGHRIKILGVVFGNTVRAKHIGKDILAGLKNIVGGELQEYTEMLSEARMEAMNRMINEARKLDADGVVNVRFTTSQTISGAAELLAYGTAVKLRKTR